MLIKDDLVDLINSLSRFYNVVNKKRKSCTNTLVCFCVSKNFSIFKSCNVNSTVRNGGLQITMN